MKAAGRLFNVREIKHLVCVRREITRIETTVVQNSKKNITRRQVEKTQNNTARGKSIVLLDLIMLKT